MKLSRVATTGEVRSLELDSPKGIRRGAAEGKPTLSVVPDLDRSDCNPPRKINVMAPLLVGDPKNPDSEASKSAFAEFEAMLRDAKDSGVHAVSTDVWWGLIEPSDGEFNFSHYDRIADAIQRAGLKWVPILSFHQCGGNVGDTVNIPIPEYLRGKYAHISSDGDGSAFCKSEQGNVSYESISPWGSAHALPDYRKVMEAFARHFAARADSIAEVNVSLGPAGELRYPSYNSHDEGTDYPSRGALQAYSTLAREDFKRFALDKYGSLRDISRAWGVEIEDENQIAPPSKPAEFFERGDDKNTEYGKDFFDWYHQSLLAHGRRVLETAQDVFGAKDSPYADIPVGAKVAGVHWRIATDRAAELAAGLIPSRALHPDRVPGTEYDSLVRTFAQLDARSESPLILHFTCLEKQDQGNDRPASLVRWVGESAERHGVPLSGENALPMEWVGEDGWKRVEQSLERLYDGITILRLPLADSAKAGLLGLKERYLDACQHGVHERLGG